jgi:uncharacterized protein (TIGR02284 family)
MSEVLVTVSDATANSLQDLIRLSVDSAEGFTAAAGMIDDTRVAELFREYAAQRTSNAEELKASVAFNGEEPASSGTTTGTLHRWWLELRSTVAGGSAAQVLTEAERGETPSKRLTNRRSRTSPAARSRVCSRRSTAGSRPHTTTSAICETRTKRRSRK